VGSTLDALTSSTTTQVVLQTVVAIEGIEYLITDGSASAATTAWAATEWESAVSGLRVKWNINQRIDPWAPFASTDSTVTLEIVDPDDTLGLMFFKREGHTVTTLTEDTNADGSDVNVRDVSAFTAPGVVHVGSEAIAYDTTNGTTKFGDLTRGYWSPFRYEGGGGFGRAHLAAENIEGFDADATSSTTVSDAPLDFKGRWVGVWLHRVVDGVLDVKAEAHLAFAGKIASYTDTDRGTLSIQCIEVREVISEAVVLRNQWRANIRDGIYLLAGARFKNTNWISYVSGGAVTITDDSTANDLVVVPVGTATPPNEIEEGQYDGSTLESAINAWLEAERAASRTLFVQTFTYHAQDPDGNRRSALRISDPTVAADGARNAQLWCTSPSVHVFFGWGGDHFEVGSTVAAPTTGYSDSEPLRIMQDPFGNLKLRNVRGSFVDQSAFMRPSLANIFGGAGGTKGFVQIGDAILPCLEPSGTADDTTVQVHQPVNLRIGAGTTAWPDLSADAEGNIEVAQVLILEGSFKKLVLAMLASTGGGGNWATHDVLADHLSAAIPYDLIYGLEDELTAAPNADHPMTVIVEKPTRLIDLWDKSFLLRGLHLMWRRGRLTLKSYATPTSTATLTLGADDRAAPLGDNDSMRAVTHESDRHMRNVVSIKHNGNPFTGTYRDLTVLRDVGSAGNFGPAPVTLTARNASSGAEIIGEDVQSLLARFAAQLTFVTRPQTLVRVPVPFTLFETLTPGETCLFSDNFARDPATGTRGITARPALIVESSYFGWGGEDAAVGEVVLAMFPRLSLAPYCPAAQVASYVAGTKTLTCEAHEQSEAADAADASHFTAGDKVRIIEIDPADPASPLTWDDTVVSVTGNDIVLTAGLAGYDAAKKYRIYSDDYGDAVTAQRTKSYQADDGDGLIADLRAPYGLASFGAGQVQSFTASTPATELAARPPDAAYGDGVALDTGHARDVARNVNALVSYLTAPQCPEVVESMAHSGTAATRTLVYAAPVFVGVGTTAQDWTRRLYVSPTIAKSGGASATVRVTLARRMPRSADPTDVSRDDVEFIAPYVQTTFTTTSATRENQTPVALSIDHLQLGEGPLGGWGWLMVEVSSTGLFYGFGLCYVGPMVTP
jgi:hypothetical protein